LSSNQLDGSIPTNFGSSSIQDLNLSSNQLTGVNIHEPRSLQRCNLASNSFLCPIPAWTESRCKAECAYY